MHTACWLGKINKRIHVENLGIHVRVWDLMEWVKLAQDREKWWVVNTVKKLPIRQNLESFCLSKEQPASPEGPCSIVTFP
jgi:hypothetical protein